MGRKIALASVLAAALLLLAAFSCGGGEPPRSPLGCTLEIRGPGVSEDLWCVAAAYDFGPMDGGSGQWSFELVAYRGSAQAPEVAAGAGLFLPSPPALGAAYGFTATSSSVDSGSAVRYAPGVFGQVTHEAYAPYDPAYSPGLGSLGVTFARVPLPGEQPIAIHGALEAVLEPASGEAGPVALRASF